MLVSAALFTALPAAAGQKAAPRKPPAQKSKVLKPQPQTGKLPPRPVKPPVIVPMDKDWPKTFNLIKSHSDPAGKKLLTWIYVTETNLPVEPHQLMEFVRENPDWPRLHVFRRKIEQSFQGSDDTQGILAWYAQNPPETFDGVKTHLDALLKTGARDKARAALADFWGKAVLNKNETAAMAGGHAALFAPDAHVARLDHLIWEGRHAEAEYMLAFVSPETRATGQARIALAKMAKNAEALLQALPASARDAEGVLFERLRWRRRRMMDAAAMEIVNAMPANVARPDIWWGELNILMRRRLEERDYAGAAAIAAKHQAKDGFAFAQAEWLLGWLKLRYLKDPVGAYRHFDGMYRNVGTAISKSRAAYWAARAAEAALPGGKTAQQWDKVAAQYASTYYGQLSYDRVYGKPKAMAFRDGLINPLKIAAFHKQEIVRAVRILQHLRIKYLMDPFLARIIANAKDKQEFALAAELAREAGRYYYAVQANKDCQQDTGDFLFFEGYPTLPRLPLAEPEKALIHAIVHRESMFDPEAVSPAGARGLMQIMPATAKATAKSLKMTYSLDKLTADARYNTHLGSAHLRDLVSDYGGFYPMAIAAYNAGGGNVKKWIEAFGDPRKGDMDVVDWIEHLSIYETRNYIQRVMESYYIYRLRFGLEPKTVADFVKRS